ncbi:ABC transporter permease [Micromonospora sp. NPDC049559]|uniref:ABC transporter permease n=1 Tax=Micromonospora sp. NPDC049559 TaxID=3155923 RepID=UPI00342EEBC0
MAYDESIYRRRGDDGAERVGDGTLDDLGYGESRYRDEGRHGGSFVADVYEPATERTEPQPDGPVDDGYDDPIDGDGGRDRLAVHLIWEVVLLLGAGALAYLMYRDYPGELRGAGLNHLLVAGTALGLLALGAGLTLRAGVPNLAIGPVALASALHFAENGDRGVIEAMAPATVTVALLGLAVAALVVGLHVPSWAASLAAALGAIVFIQQRVAPVQVQGDYDPTGEAWYLAGGFAALAVLGGLLGTIRTLRRTVGRFRPVGDPAVRRGALAGVVVALTLVVSMIFAMLAGVLIAANGTGPVRPTSGLEWTGLALGAVLVAGTSAFGRRGGVLGTLLSVSLLTLFITYADRREWHIALAAIAAVVVAGGLLVTRLVESYGRPRPGGPDDLWRRAPAGTPAPSWESPRSDRADSWSSSLPAQRAESRVDPWDPDRWR